MDKLRFMNDYSTLFPDEHELSESSSTKYKAKLCEITAKVTGITFENVDRKLLRDDIYIYTAEVITKTISFDIELTVILKVYIGRILGMHSETSFVYRFIFVVHPMLNKDKVIHEDYPGFRTQPIKYIIL